MITKSDITIYHSNITLAKRLQNICHTVLSVPDSIVVTYLNRADLLALLCVILSFYFVTFPYGVLGQVWYLIVLSPDLCLRFYFEHENSFKTLGPV